MSDKQKLDPVSSTTGADSVDMLSQRRFCFKVKFIFFLLASHAAALQCSTRKKNIIKLYVSIRVLWTTSSFHRSLTAGFAMLLEGS